MDGHQEPVSWDSARSEVRLNPRWPAEAARVLRQAAEEILDQKAVEPSLVLASSGSTAGSWREIKLILISKRAFLTAARSVATRFVLGPDDVLMNSLPQFHVGGLSIGARAHVSGAKLAERDEAAAPSVEGLWDDVLAARATALSLVPTQLYDLLERKVAVPAHLRLVFMGGAALTPALEAQARAKKWPLVATYGMTETAAMFAVRTEPDPEAGFEALEHVELSRAENGLLRVRGASLASGFGRLDASGGWSWTPLRDPQGWFTTEDRALERGGRWFLQGRDSDYVKILGEAVNLGFLRERLEKEALRSGLDPRGFHLTWLPDERRGASLVLFVEDRMPDLAALVASFHEEALPFERIQEQRRIARLPRTPLGKIADHFLFQKHRL